jgi:hypothetical protein
VRSAPLELTSDTVPLACRLSEGAGGAERKRSATSGPDRERGGCVVCSVSHKEETDDDTTDNINPRP